MVDFRSDTVTKPTKQMLEAMVKAEVGDDVYCDDITVKKLEDKLAKMLGKESGLFVPSGTFCNQLAIQTHTKRGDEIIVLDNSHILIHEAGASAVWSGVNMRMASNELGEYDIDELRKLINSDDIHHPKTALICLENAHGNGRAIPLYNMEKVYNLAKENGIKVHLDGARIFNAAVSLAVSPKEIADYSDTVSVCISKGLCAPIGSVLLGDKEFIKKARRNRKMMGGGLRQAGYLAACGIYALDHLVKRLIDDHNNADYLAVLLDDIEEIEVFWRFSDINMVFFKLELSEVDLATELFKRDILINPSSDGVYRVVTHKDLEKSDMDKLQIAIKEILNEVNS